VLASFDGRFNVYLTGIGGSGIVTVNRLLARAAIIGGYHVAGMDQTGLSQKAGAVVSHLLLATSEVDLATNTVGASEAHLYLSGDLLQAAAAQHLAKTSPGRTFAVIDAELMPSSTMLQTGESMDPLRLRSTIEHRLGVDHVAFIDSTSLAIELFSNHLMANVILLGAAYQAGAIPLPASAIEAAIAEGAAAEANLAAFRWGRWAVVDPTLLPSASAPDVLENRTMWPEPAPAILERARELAAASQLPADLRPLIERRIAQVIDYQSTKLAREYLRLVQLVAERDLDQSHELTTAVTDSWFKLLTYKDEYEVARLHLGIDWGDLAREAGVTDSFRVKFQLHPPILRSLGMNRKIALDRTARPAFTLLRAMRRLRGTPLDLFGWSRHRREERAVVREYRTKMEYLALRPIDDYGAAVLLARLPMDIKGYGDIKSAAISRWRSQSEGGVESVRSSGAATEALLSS
jgi:indolepyruvate ferredoxin oxidoreductase